MSWNTVLDKWASGEYFTPPEKADQRFHWNTSVLKNGGDTKFKQKVKVNNKLPSKQSSKSFKKQITASKDKYSTSFPNLSGDTILVVPIPRAGKNYATLFDFCANAPIVQQQEFWKMVSKVAREQMKKFKKVWVSTHGLGVPYLHVRISDSPKYYFSEALSVE
jgi:hypothetical protein